MVNYINFVVSVTSICLGFIFIFWSAFILHLKPIEKFSDSWDATKKGKQFSLYWLFFTDLRNILMGFAMLQMKTEILIFLLLVVELIAFRLYIIVKDESSKVIYALKLFEKCFLLALLLTLLGISACSIPEQRNV